MRPLGRISQIRTTREGTVQIPIAFFHRVALGLETGTTVHVAPVLPQKTNHEFVEELIITTFKPEWWQDMFRLSLRMTERKGAVAIALETIQKHGGNIAVLENVTTEAGTKGTHHILAFVHIPNAGLDGLLAELLPLVKDGLPENLKHEPLQRLKDCHEHLGTTQPHRVVMRGKRISIPATIFRSLVCPRSTGHRSTPTRTLIFSDSEEKFIQCYFPRSTDIIMVITVNHRETKGAIHSFSQAVSRTKANILGSFSRLESAGDSAEWKAVIDVTKANCPVSGIISKIARNVNHFFHFSDVTLSFLETSGGRNLTLPPSPTAESTEEFTGRASEINEIMSGIIPNNRANRSNYIVNGFSKAGKTAMLYHLRKLLDDHTMKDLVHHSYVQLQGPNIESFWATLCQQISKLDSKREPNDEIVHPAAQLVSSRATNTSQMDSYKYFLGGIERLTRPLVLFIDEAQYLLHPEEENRQTANQILRQITGLGVAQHADAKNASVAWVLADRDAWKQDHSLETGLRAKFVEVLLRRLTQKEGYSISTSTFKKAGLVSDYLEEVHQQIAKACNNQPFFIQTVTRRILQFVNLAPAAIDVVDSTLIERAILKAANEDLRSHFADTVNSLQSICHQEALKKLLSNRNPVLVSSLLQKGHSIEDLAIFPGLVVHRKKSNGHPSVGLVSLMRYWRIGQKTTM